MSALPGAPLLAETTAESAAVFGLRQDVLDISLSPSGNRLAYVSAGALGSEELKIVDLKGGAEVRTILSVREQNTDLNSCEWATEEQLVCQVYVTYNDAGTLLGFSRLFALGADGEDMQTLTARYNSRATGIRQDGGNLLALDTPGEENRVLISTEFVKQSDIGTRTASSDEGLGVEAVDVTNGRRTIVERGERIASKYIADDTGRIRIRAQRPEAVGGNMGDRVVYLFRDATSDKWRRLSETTVNAQGSTSGFVPVAVDSKRNVAYGYDTLDGYTALAEVALAEGAAPQVISQRGNVDVDGLVYIGRQRRAVGISYATEKPMVDYFDAELKQLAKGLQRALPGNPMITFAGASADESKLLVIASSDTNPGMVYLFDKSTKQLNELLPVRRYMDGRQLAEMKPVSFPAGDGTMIPAYLTLPAGSDGRNLPAVVLPHGGPSARDYWGFDWLVQFLAARGYAVLQPNYRGSSGYGDAWFGRNGFQAWETAVGDINDAGKWLASQGIADKDRLAIVGWSYGGYAALQSQVLDPSLYQAVVAIAPVTDLEQLRQEARPYTSYMLVDKFIGNGPHVDAGSPARHADRFAAPVLLVHGTMDQNVDVQESRTMNKRLRDAGKPVAYAEYEGLDHSLSDSKVRSEVLEKIDGFLSQELGR